VGVSAEVQKQARDIFEIHHPEVDLSTWRVYWTNRRMMSKLISPNGAEAIIYLKNLQIAYTPTYNVLNEIH
jgi:hypothetical protein